MTEQHAYVSTACHHDLHARCRMSCKFCGTPCACPCHENGHRMSTRDALTDKLAECAAEGRGAREIAVTLLADPVLLDEVCEYRARQINALAAEHRAESAKAAAEAAPHAARETADALAEDAPFDDGIPR